MVTDVVPAAGARPLLVAVIKATSAGAADPAVAPTAKVAVLSNKVREDEFVPPVNVVLVAPMVKPCVTNVVALGAFNNVTLPEFKLKVAPLPFAATPVALAATVLPAPFNVVLVVPVILFVAPCTKLVEVPAAPIVFVEVAPLPIVLVVNAAVPKAVLPVVLAAPFTVSICVPIALATLPTVVPWAPTALLRVTAPVLPKALSAPDVTVPLTVAFPSVPRAISAPPFVEIFSPVVALSVAVPTFGSVKSNVAGSRVLL